MSETILTICAGGKFAGLVIPALTKRGFTLRGMVHKVDDAAQVRKQGASEVVVGDLADPAAQSGIRAGIRADSSDAKGTLP